VNTACHVIHHGRSAITLSPFENTIETYEHHGHIVIVDNFERLNSYTLQQLIHPFSFCVLICVFKCLLLEKIITCTWKSRKYIYTNKKLFGIRCFMLYLPITACSLSLVSLTAITFRSDSHNLSTSRGSPDCSQNKTIWPRNM